MAHLWLFLLGLAVGAFGTLIGAGGGFVLMPILLLAYPGRPPAELTAVSLVVVCVNAASGTWSYARMRRVDFRSGLLFLVTGIPGAVAGAYGVQFIPRRTFDLAFGLLLLAGAGLILLNRFDQEVDRHRVLRATMRRTLTDARGRRHVYSYNLALGMALSFAVGVASSLLGIGGGIIHVPAMAGLLNFPVHIATATSHFILAAMALVGALVHLASGTLPATNLLGALPLAVGAVVGAQFGARLSSRVQGPWILRILAVTLGLVAVRLMALGLRQA